MATKDSERVRDAKAVISWAIGLVAWFWFLGTTLLWIVGLTPLGHDDSDPDSSWGFRHSRMDVLTDHLTGCQYLARNGGLVPRMDKDGKQVGCR